MQLERDQPVDGGGQGRADGARALIRFDAGSDPAHDAEQEGAGGRVGDGDIARGKTLRK